MITAASGIKPWVLINIVENPRDIEPAPKVDEEVLRLRPPNKPRVRRHIPTLEGASHAICPRRSQSVLQAGVRLKLVVGPG